MAIPNIPSYTGQKPDPSQPQPQFNQNVSDELDYFNDLPENLNPAIDEMNNTATQVTADKDAAGASATAAGASATAAGASATAAGASATAADASATNALNAELAIKDFIDGQDLPGEPPATGGPYVYINGGWVEFPAV